MKIMSNLESLVEFTTELRNSLPIPKLQRKPIALRDPSALYNIHKRSVPPCIDKPIVIGVPRVEADLEVVKFIQKEEKRRTQQIMDEPETNVFFYFDIIPQDAKPFERDIYYNEGSPVL